MDVDTSAATSSRSPTSEQPSALQDVATNLASVKSAIRTGAADRNQVIDMLTNLLRETLQVEIPLLAHSHVWQTPTTYCKGSAVSGACLKLSPCLNACSPCGLQQSVLRCCRIPLLLPATT